MIKDIIDKIIQDLGDDKPIKGILLKAQIVASQLNNKEFEEWIKSEQNGRVVFTTDYYSIFYR